MRRFAFIELSKRVATRCRRIFCRVESIGKLFWTCVLIRQGFQIAKPAPDFAAAEMKAEKHFRATNARLFARRYSAGLTELFSSIVLRDG